MVLSVGLAAWGVWKALNGCRFLDRRRCAINALLPVAEMREFAAALEVSVCACAVAVLRGLSVLVGLPLMAICIIWHALAVNQRA